MVRISVLSHQFGGEDRKKGLRCEILVFVVAFTCGFRPGMRLYTPSRGTSSILGGKGPEMHSSGTGPVTFFYFSLGEAQAVIWENTAPKCPPWHRSWLSQKTSTIRVRLIAPIL